ncbi:MAG: hypothetical protein JNL75_06045 [Chitinophagales bacterium]|nr:hypothetical protein [Chitinophagales bacterium]
MQKIVPKTVNLDLVGVDANAFSILGAFGRQARREGWTKEEIDLVTEEAKTGDYDHLLAVIMNHCEVEDGDDVDF